MIDVKEAATHKIGPLPAWAWGAVVGGGVLVYRLVSGGGSSSPFAATLAGGTPYDYEALAAAGGAGGGGGGSTTPPPKNLAASTTAYTRALTAFRAGTGANPGAYTDWSAKVIAGTWNPYLTTTPTTPTTPVPTGTVDSRLLGPTGGTPTGASQPIYTTPTTTRTQIARGDTSGRPLPLGVTLPRWDAILATQAAAAESYAAPGPVAPSFPVPIPGTVTGPTLPPLLRAQGDTAARAMLSPRGWVASARARAYGPLVPTTTAQSVLARVQRARQDRIAPTTD